jgi:hypothetical protein
MSFVDSRTTARPDGSGRHHRYEGVAVRMARSHQPERQDARLVDDHPAALAKHGGLDIARTPF